MTTATEPAKLPKKMTDAAKFAKIYYNMPEDYRVGPIFGKVGTFRVWADENCPEILDDRQFLRPCRPSEPLSETNWRVSFAQSAWTSPIYKFRGVRGTAAELALILKRSRQLIHANIQNGTAIEVADFNE